MGCSTGLLEFEKNLMSLLAETKCHVIPATKFKFFTSTWQFFLYLSVFIWARWHLLLRKLYANTFSLRMIASNIWLLMALFKVDLSCCSKRLKLLTVWEVKWCLWHLSKTSCITFKSESETPYTARPYVRIGRTRVLYKWSISFWLKSSFRRVLRMGRHLLAFVSLSLTCLLNSQLGWKVSLSNTRSSHWGMLLMGAYWWSVLLLLIKVLFFVTDLCITVRRFG